MSLFALAAMDAATGGVHRPMRITVKHARTADVGKCDERPVATVIERDDGQLEVVVAEGVTVRTAPENPVFTGEN